MRVFCRKPVHVLTLKHPYRIIRIQVDNSGMILAIAICLLNINNCESVSNTSLLPAPFGGGSKRRVEAHTALNSRVRRKCRVRAPEFQFVAASLCVFRN